MKFSFTSILLLITVVYSQTTVPNYTPIDESEQINDIVDRVLGAGQTAQEMRLFGDYTVEANTVSNDKIRIIGGNLIVDGTVYGTITLVGGDVFLNSTAIIEGKVITIGGSIHTEDGAQINGSVIETNLKEGLVYREYEQEAIVKGESDLILDRRSERARSDWIFPDFTIFYYNRNEGLVINPINEKWDRRGRSSFKLTTNLGYRFGPGDLIGRLGFERGFGINNNLILFISAFKESRTDDGYRLHKNENTVANIFARQDFLDHWEEQGISAGFGFDISFLKVKMSWSSVDQDTLPVIDLWSVFEKNRQLRPNINIAPGKAEYVETTIATRTKHFNPFRTGFAGMVNISSYYENGLEVNPIGDNTRIFGLGIVNWEFSKGLVIRNRTIVGTSMGELPIHRMFGIGGLGSVAAYPYKIQTGNQMIQTNIELHFTPEFLDHGFGVFTFIDIGHAWDNSDYTHSNLMNHYDEMIKSVGLGFNFNQDHDDDDHEIGFIISKPIDGPDIIETTIRFGFTF